MATPLDQLLTADLAAMTEATESLPLTDRQGDAHQVPTIFAATPWRREPKSDGQAQGRTAVALVQTDLEIALGWSLERAGQRWDVQTATPVGDGSWQRLELQSERSLTKSRSGLRMRP